MGTGIVALMRLAVSGVVLADSPDIPKVSFCLMLTGKVPETADEFAI